MDRCPDPLGRGLDVRFRVIHRNEGRRRTRRKCRGGGGPEPSNDGAQGFGGGRPCPLLLSDGGMVTQHPPLPSVPHPRGRGKERAARPGSGNRSEGPRRPTGCVARPDRPRRPADSKEPRKGLQRSNLAVRRQRGPFCNIGRSWFDACRKRGWYSQRNTSQNVAPRVGRACSPMCEVRLRLRRSPAAS